MRTTRDGRGYINVLAADKLMQSPRLYATFLLLAAVRAVREAARGRRPRQAEARLLLRRGASPVQRRAQGAAREGRAGGAADPLEGRRRLFRDAEPARHSRHRVAPARQPRAACASRLHAEGAEGGEGGGRRPSAPIPAFDTEKAIMELGIGEALVSTLDEKGQPTMVERTLVRPPNSRVGPITEAERKTVIKASPVRGEYEEADERDPPMKRCRSGRKTARRGGGQSRGEGGGEEIRKRIAQRQLLDHARQDHHQDRRAIGDEGADGCTQGPHEARRRVRRVRRRLIHARTVWSET